MTYIYQLIVILFIAYLVIMLYKEKKIQNQINISLVLIPLILRLLMIK